MMMMMMLMMMMSEQPPLLTGYSDIFCDENWFPWSLSADQLHSD
jgi:hypothetical protein